MNQTTLLKSIKFLDFLKNPPKDLPKDLQLICSIISKDYYSEPFLKKANTDSNCFTSEKIVELTDLTTTTIIPYKSWQQLLNLRYSNIDDVYISKLVTKNITVLLDKFIEKEYSGD
jgi:hypothetical protein